MKNRMIIGFVLTSVGVMVLSIMYGAITVGAFCVLMIGMDLMKN